MFADLKRIPKLDQLRLRAPSAAHEEFLLVVTLQNRRRMAKKLLVRKPEDKLAIS